MTSVAKAERPNVGILRLYEVAEELEVVMLTLEENEGELTPELAALLDAWGMAFDAKVENVVHVIRNLEATAEVVRKEAQRLAAVARVRENAADGLRRYLLDQMERARRDEVKTTLVSVRVSRSTVPRIEWIGTEAQKEIPEAFQKIEVSLDRDMVKDAWKVGLLPEGFKVDFTKHVTIR